MISRVRPVLPDFLAELERVGITDLSRNRYYGPEMHERLRGLHVSSCLAHPPAAALEPGFYVYPEATGAWVGDGEEIRLFCEEFLGDAAQADVLGKLAGSGADERHAVVIATHGQLGLHTAVDLRLTPSQAPAPQQVRRLAVGDRLPRTCQSGGATGHASTAGPQPHLPANAVHWLPLA